MEIVYSYSWKSDTGKESIMKKIRLLISLVATGFLCIMASAGTPWLTDQSAAETAARKEGKPILMLFTGSDWCPYCVQMEKQVYSSPEFQTFAKEKLVLLMLDFPARKALPKKTRRQNQLLQQKYDIRGFPTCILAAPDGKELLRISGARSKGEFLTALNEAVAQTKK